jgi:hypothetical protein
LRMSRMRLIINNPNQIGFFAFLQPGSFGK